MRRMSPRGFTVIELMLVVAILGILAAVALLQYRGWIEKSAEGATKAGLGTLRNSAAIYYGDHEGQWPVELDDAPRCAFSRYITHIPLVRVTGRFDPNLHTKPQGRWMEYSRRSEVPTDQNVGWLYDSSTGNIYVNSTLRDSKTIPYSFYGFE